MKFLPAKRLTTKDKVLNKISNVFSGAKKGLSDTKEKVINASGKSFLSKIIYEKHKKNLTRRANKVYYKDELNKYSIEIATFYDLDIYYNYAIFSCILFKKTCEVFSHDKNNLNFVDNNFILLKLISLSMQISINDSNVVEKTSALLEENNELFIGKNNIYLKNLKGLYQSIIDFLNEVDQKDKEEFFNNINAYAINYTNDEKTKRDFAKYLFTPTDGEKFRLMGSWVFAATGVALTLVFCPPIGAGALVALAVVGPILTLAFYVGPKIKDILFRKRINYFIDERKFKERLNNVEFTEKKFNEMRDLIHNFKRMLTNTDMFNNYFSNAFDYYCKLKEISDTQIKNTLKNEGTTDKNYKSLRNELELYYYKLLGYFRLKKGYQGNIKIQTEGLKELCLKCVYLLRNDSDFKTYVNIHKESISKHINKFSNKLRKKKKVDSKIIDSLEAYIINTLITDDFIEIKQKKDLESKINSLNSEFESILKKDTSISFDILNKTQETLQASPASLITGLKGMAEQKIFPSTTYIDPGLFLISSSIESLLFLSASSSLGLLESHKRVFSILKKISNIFTSLKLGVSIGMVIAYKVGWINLFTTGMSHIYVNPFQIILNVLSVSIEAAIEKNYVRHWNEMYKKLKEYVNDQDIENSKYPLYSYFTKEFGNSKMTAITKMSNVFKDKFIKISGLLDEINRSSKHLCKAIQENIASINKFEQNNDKHKCYNTESDKAYKSFEKYCEIILQILSASHEIKELDFYVQCIYSFDPEIDKLLKINSSSIFLENKDFFLLNYFQQDPIVETKCSQ
nr:hypothetical protein GTC16762_13650 [Pigmentibacter ruber]